MRRVIDSIEDLQQTIWTWLGQDFSFDIETTGLDDASEHIVGLALTFENEDTYYIVLEHTVPNPNKEGDFHLSHFIGPKQFRDTINTLFCQTGVTMVAHHAKFEWKFFARAGIFIRGGLFDTMNAAQCLDENRPSDLKSLGNTLLGMNMEAYAGMEHYPGFSSKEILGVPLPLVSEYAMNDSLATWRLYVKFSEQLERTGMDRIFRGVVMPLLPTLAEMEMRGIAMDMEKVHALQAEYGKKVRKLEQEIQAEGVKMIQTMTDFNKEYLRMATPEEIDAAYENLDGQTVVDTEIGTVPLIIPTPRSKPRVATFNPGSHKQLGDLLYNFYNIQPPKEFKMKRKEDGTLSVDKNSLEILHYSLGDASPPILKNIVALRKASKFLSTYLDNFATLTNPNDSYSIRTTFNQHITDTGRLSSSQPLNLQNIPSRGDEGKKARDLFVCRPGYKLVVGDFSQMELRMLAHYSQDPVLLQAFEEGKDLHILTGVAQSGILYEDLKARYEAGDADAKRIRQIAKTSNFGLVYGMGAKKFQIYLLVENGMYLPLEECQNLVASFNQNWAVAREWGNRVQKYVRSHGYAQTIGGRKRRLAAQINSEDRYEAMRAERQAVNFVIQGSCGDVMGWVMPPVHTMFKSLGGSLLLQIHDELVGEVPEQYAPLAADLMAKLMMGVVNPKLKVPMYVEASHGISWGSAKG